MDRIVASGAGLTELPIPTEGLHEVLRRWNGRGRLYDAVAAVDDGHPWSWRRSDVERRASRVLFQQLVPRLAGWPRRLIDWIDALPAQSTRERFVSPTPRRGTSWGESRRYGWPPYRFAGRTRTRVAFRDLVAGLRWTLQELTSIADRATTGGTGVEVEVRQQMAVARAAQTLQILQAVDSEAPNAETRRMMRREGRPWVGVADVADVLQKLNDNTLYDLAQELIAPDPELRWRLFHLAVFGTLLQELLARGANIISRRPLADSSFGPAYEVTIRGRTWDLWFEAGGLWRAYNIASPYRGAMAGLSKSLRSRSPDLALVDRGGRALILECKYSSDLDYVCQAYAQITAYANEFRSGVVSEVVAMVVAPEGVTTISSVDTAIGRIGIAPPSQLGAILDVAVRA